jgi:hypothetical protein
MAVHISPHNMTAPEKSITKARSALLSLKDVPSPETDPWCPPATIIGTTSFSVLFSEAATAVFEAKRVALGRLEPDTTARAKPDTRSARASFMLCVSLGS